MLPRVAPAAGLCAGPDGSPKPALLTAAAPSAGKPQQPRSKLRAAASSGPRCNARLCPPTPRADPRPQPRTAPRVALGASRRSLAAHRPGRGPTPWQSPFLASDNPRVQLARPPTSVLLAPNRTLCSSPGGNMAGGDGDGEPLLTPQTQFAARRPYRDVGWSLTWGLFLLLTLVGSGVAFTKRNPDFGVMVSSDYLSDPGHCPAGAGPTRRLLTADGQLAKPTLFLEAAGACTAVSLAGALALGVAALWLWKARPHTMVAVSCGLQVGLPAAAGLAIAANAGLGAGAPLFVLAGVLGFTLWLYRPQLALVGRLLKVAAACVSDNAGPIIGGSLLIQLGGLLLLAPLLAGGAFAYANGGVVPNPAAAAVAKGGQLGCVDASGSDVLCCAWQPEPWALGLMGVVGLMLGWTSLLVFSVKVFSVSSITAQWYFAPPGSKPAAPLSTSLRHALGASFGSLCLASWLLNLLATLKSALQQARSEGRDNFLLALLASCAQLLISVLEQVTKFAVVRIAIDGSGLWDACASTTALLARNLLDTVGVWWLPGMILQVTSLLLAGSWALVVGGGAYSYWGASSPAAGSSALALVGLSFVLAWGCLAYLSGVLCNIVDAAYVCYALDRDAHAVTRLEVHEVFAATPANKAPGGVVEQPDASYAYARV